MRLTYAALRHSKFKIEVFMRLTYAALRHSKFLKLRFF